MRRFDDQSFERWRDFGRLFGGLVLLLVAMDCGDQPQLRGHAGDAEIAVSDPDQGASDQDEALSCSHESARCRNDQRAQVCGEGGSWESVDCNDDELCWGGACGRIGTCEPWSVEACEGYDRYRGCNPIGTDTGKFDVPFNQTCVEGAAGAELALRVCLTGETRCDGDVQLRCDESGLVWEFAQNCLCIGNPLCAPLGEAKPGEPPEGICQSQHVCEEGECVPICR